MKAVPANDYLNSSTFLDGPLTLFPDDPGDWLFGGDGDDIVIGGWRQVTGCSAVTMPVQTYLSGRGGDDFLDGGPGRRCAVRRDPEVDRLMGGDGDDILSWRR
ncbi:MAG: hypothetical protein U5P41_02055 [Gammaproteobacteria bacterium]|nr:hypothetical protein [Gammaproteobacteria bacterium]